MDVWVFITGGISIKEQEEHHATIPYIQSIHCSVIDNSVTHIDADWISATIYWETINTHQGKIYFGYRYKIQSQNVLSTNQSKISNHAKLSQPHKANSCSKAILFINELWRSLNHNKWLFCQRRFIRLQSKAPSRQERIHFKIIIVCHQQLYSICKSNSCILTVELFASISQIISFHKSQYHFQYKIGTTNHHYQWMSLQLKTSFSHTSTCVHFFIATTALSVHINYLIY